MLIKTIVKETKNVLIRRIIVILHVTHNKQICKWNRVKFLIIKTNNKSEQEMKLHRREEK